MPDSTYAPAGKAAIFGNDTRGTARPRRAWELMTSVKWGDPHDRAEGGSMMKRVDVRGGELVKVTLP